MIKKISVALSLSPGSISIWAKHISTFLLGQGSVQLVQLLSGFLLIHWLSVEEYAQYSIAFAFQSTAQTLIGLGFSGSVIALVGNRIREKETVGKYIKAGKFFRNRLFLIIGGACLIAFPLMSNYHGWPIFGMVFLLIAILSNLYFMGDQVYYSSPLLMHKKIGFFYKTQFKSGALRLLFLGVLSSLSALNAWLAAFSSSFMVWNNGRFYKRKAKQYIIEPEQSDYSTRAEMLKYVRPVIPGIIYSAFSAQIGIFVIGIFGNPENIAEVGALGRIGQLFIILNTASSTLIVPYLAKQPKEGLRKKYLSLLGIALLIAAFLSIFSFVLPAPFLWVIGNKYAHLGQEVGLLILNASIVFLNVLMWDMNCSRKWLWSWIPIVSISSNIIIQVLLIVEMDLSTTYNVLVFTIILSLFNLLNKIIVAFIGLKRTKKNETDLLSSE